jgi:FixJ family two-component response regulator
MSLGPDGSPTATVFIVDDDLSVRRGLSRLLRSAGYETGTFSSAQDFLASPLRTKPECLVLDVHLPGLSGVDLQAELTRAGDAPPIVFITGLGDIPTSVKAMKQGAVDFLTKPFEAQALLDAVAQALARGAQARGRKALEAALMARLGTLTPREREVFDGVVRGLLNKQIALQLGTAEKTIKVHRGRVMKKLGATSVAELVRMAEQVSGARDR